MKRAALFLFLGLWLGAALALAGFGDYEQVHRMLLLRDLRMLFTFMCAVGLSMVVLAVAFPGSRPRSERVTWRTVAGALVFGAGWGIGCACPAGSLVQVATGYLPGVVSILSIFVGIGAASWAQRRYHWPRTEC
jgi:hypothetical protein